ncbi:MAG: sortase [Lachnospiraceae bacterium]|nr:sortase [Lachnospiraceae bacterium]
MPEEKTENSIQTRKSRQLTEKKKKNRRIRWIYNGILILLLGVILFSGYQIYSKTYYYKKAQKVYEALESDVVQIVDGPPQYTREAVLPTSGAEDPAQTLPAASVPAASGSAATDPAVPGTTKNSQETLTAVSPADPSQETAEPAETSPAETRQQETSDPLPVPVSYPTPKGEMPWLSVNFTELLRRNSDVVGWLYGQGGHINHPVVQGRDNSYYLHRLLDGSWNYAGTLFADYRNRFLEDDLTIIYGHHMRNDTMFGLMELWDDYEYYLQNPTLRLYTPTAVYELQIMASVYSDVDEPLMFNFGGRDDYQKVVQSFLRRSTISTGVTAEYGDKLVCLYTCAYQVDDGRQFLICKLVQIA